MKNIGILAVLALAGAAHWTTGCGGSSGLACDMTVANSHTCYDYSDIDTDTCPTGTKVDACPADMQLGSCAQTAGGYTAAVYYYEGTGVTADTAKMACEAAGGTWTAK
jgi:hypothetical protein